MARLCERPGCGESASVAYGFDAERGMVWLEALPPTAGPTGGVLCRRHADAIVLPKGWWLQDRRSDSTLFTATPAPPAATYRPKRPRRRAVTPPPLPLEPEPAAGAADDLDGLLVATTPLLSRAFRQPIPPASNA